jgi:hypothetical protein
MWWHQKGVTLSIGLTVQLLRLQALHQRHYCYAPLFDYIIGESNALADACI